MIVPVYINYCEVVDMCAVEYQNKYDLCVNKREWNNRLEHINYVYSLWYLYGHVFNGYARYGEVRKKCAKETG